jgi:hypothetical protein
MYFVAQYHLSRDRGSTDNRVSAICRSPQGAAADIELNWG